jgi:TPR repeat
MIQLVAKRPTNVASIETPRSEVESAMARCRWYLPAILALLAGGCGDPSSRTPEQLVHVGRFDEAIEASTQLIRGNPRDAEAYLYRGRAYHCRNQQGDVARAIEDFTQAIQIAPEQSEAYYSRALAYHDSGNEEGSAADEASARKHDPRLAEVYSQLPEVVAEPATVETKPEQSAEKKSASDESDKVLAPRDERRGIKGLSSRRNLPGSTAGIDANGGAEIVPVPVPPKRVPFGPTDKERLDAMLADDDTEAPAPVAPESSKKKSKGRARSVPGGWDPTDGRAGVMPSDPFASPATKPFYQQPMVRSPFPQRAPRPTGFVEEQPLSPQGTQPRQLYNNPYSAPTVRPPGAYHDDFNP